MRQQAQSVLQGLHHGLGTGLNQFHVQTFPICESFLLYVTTCLLLLLRSRLRSSSWRNLCRIDGHSQYIPVVRFIVCNHPRGVCVPQLLQEGRRWFYKRVASRRRSTQCCCRRWGAADASRCSKQQLAKVSKH